MHWCCDICDKIMYEISRNNHLQSSFHKRLVNSIIRKYIITYRKPKKMMIQVENIQDRTIKIIQISGYTFHEAVNAIESK